MDSVALSRIPAADIRKALGRDDPQDAARRLIGEARRRGGPDNITAVVLRLEEVAVAGADDAAGEATTAIIDADAEQTAVLPAVEATTAFLPAPGGEEAAPGEGEPGSDDAAGEDLASTPVAPAEMAAADEGRRRKARRLGLVVVVLSLVLLVGVAGAFTTSAVFFVGVDGGRLVVYSGVPVKVGNERLNPVYRKSTRSYDSLSPQQKALVDAQTIHDRDGVMALATALGMWP